MAFDRRSFFKVLGLSAAIAPTVRGGAKLPDHEPEKFLEHARPDPVRRHLAFPYFALRFNDVLWDRIRFEPGQRLPHYLRLFQNPLGSTCSYTGRLKTLRYTNMLKAGALSPPQEFLARHILFAVHPTVAEADLEQLSAEAVWEFQLTQRIFMRGPMLLNGPARAGIRDIIARDGHHVVDDIPQVVTETEAVNPSGLYIPSLAYFSFNLITEGTEAIRLLPSSEGGRGLDLLIALRGCSAIPIQ